MQQLQPLCDQFGEEVVHAGGVAPGPIKAGDEAELGRVIRDHEQDRDGHCGRLRRISGVVVRRRDDQGHVTLDQVGGQLWKLIVSALRVPIFNCYVLTPMYPPSARAARNAAARFPMNAEAEPA
jgi:hypothetical protein